MSEPQPLQFTGNGGEMGEEERGFGFRSLKQPRKDEAEQKLEAPDDDYCPSIGQVPSPTNYKATVEAEHRKLNSLEHGAFTLTGVSGQP